MIFGNSVLIWRFGFILQVYFLLNLSGEDTTDKPSFRWDGTPLVDKTKESKLVKKVKSLDQQESGIAVIGNNRSELGQFRTNPINSDQFRSNNQMMPQRQRSAEDSTPPIPPIRESSVKREEIK